MAAGLGAGMDGGGLRGEYWDNCNRITKNDKVRKQFELNNNSTTFKICKMLLKHFLEKNEQCNCLYGKNGKEDLKGKTSKYAQSKWKKY